MATTTSKRVLETVWPWQAGPQAAPKSGGMPMGVRGLLQALVMGIIGFLLYRWIKHETMAIVVWSLAGVVLLSSWFVPPVFKAIERFGQKLGHWAGTGLTWLLLVPFFYVVFVPGRLVMRLLGKDPMQRGFPTPETTCWSPRKTKLDASHYRRQFS